MKKWRLTIVVVLMIFAIAITISIDMDDARRNGFCEGKRYDGYEWVANEWCCYRREDGFFVAVPIKVLKEE